jgi:hypothetical protein
MTIRFAAAWGGATPVIVKALCPSAPLSAANDNGGGKRLSLGRCRRGFPSGYPVDQELLAETLRHFARHGLAAAAQARTHAEACAAAGDGAGRDRWIAICRQLDRRMAEACSRGLAARASRSG